MTKGDISDGIGSGFVKHPHFCDEGFGSDGQSLPLIILSYIINSNIT